MFACFNLSFISETLWKKVPQLSYNTLTQYSISPIPCSAAKATRCKQATWLPWQKQSSTCYCFIIGRGEAFEFGTSQQYPIHWSRLACTSHASNYYIDNHQQLWLPSHIEAPMQTGPPTLIPTHACYLPAALTAKNKWCNQPSHCVISYQGHHVCFCNISRISYLFSHAC